MYRVWHSTESFADYIIDNTLLSHHTVVKNKLYESDANNSKNFHTVPDHIKKILYLDCPDLIVEKDGEPIFAIEETKEAGTGHNAFQRFARIAAAVENNVPVFYIYPEAVIVARKNGTVSWDKINPLVFRALDETMNIYDIPALLYYFPTDFSDFPDAKTVPHLKDKGIRFNANYRYAGCPETDGEMSKMFECMNEIITVAETLGAIAGKSGIIKSLTVRERRRFVQSEFSKKSGSTNMSPLTATKIVPTEYLLNYLSQYETTSYKVGELLRSRQETVVYMIDAGFRGDPYAGAIAAIDYLLCREGKSFEERRHNLVMLWGNLTIDDNNKVIKAVDSKGKITISDFVEDVNKSEQKNILSMKYTALKSEEIPRFYMQVRYGSTYSKAKHIRVFSYFADAIIFPDGALWRDA